MDVSVIVVSYHSADCLRECVESVLSQREIGFELIVVDNASTDSSAEVLKSFGEKLTFIQNRENVGFGRACNQAAASRVRRYLYFLNPDAHLVGEQALARLCRAMDQHPAWGMAGSRVLSAELSLKPTNSHYPDERHVHKDFSRLPGKIAWVVGASMIVRRKIFEELGGFDPAFFLYGEETDLCLRLRQLGHEIGYVDEVEVRHIGGASERGRDPYEVWTRRTRGIHQFWAKHYPVKDVERLVRRNIVRARYRMLVNGALASIQASGSEAWQKQRRYKAVWEVSRNFSKRI
ncbi:MAG TPA: glycosyltransferase family 2 protein [Candidatus Dormibacteraeota bacterium]|nr:glycosyltransferase family 2 protein [Candidatus Dormibacteraeota bacterium]